MAIFFFTGIPAFKRTRKHIDYSDIPETNAEFLKNAEVHLPKKSD